METRVWGLGDGGAFEDGDASICVALLASESAKRFCMMWEEEEKEGEEEEMRPLCLRIQKSSNEKREIATCDKSRI